MPDKRNGGVQDVCKETGTKHCDCQHWCFSNPNESGQSNSSSEPPNESNPNEAERGPQFVAIGLSEVNRRLIARQEMDEDPQAPRTTLAPGLSQIDDLHEIAQESWRREPSIQQLAPPVNRSNATVSGYGTIGEIAQGRELWRADPDVPPTPEEAEEGDAAGEEDEPEQRKGRQERN